MNINRDSSNGDLAMAIGVALAAVATTRKFYYAINHDDEGEGSPVTADNIIASLMQSPLMAAPYITRNLARFKASVEFESRKRRIHDLHDKMTADQKRRAAIMCSAYGRANRIANILSSIDWSNRPFSAEEKVMVGFGFYRRRGGRSLVDGTATTTP